MFLCGSADRINILTGRNRFAYGSRSSSNLGGLPRSPVRLAWIGRSTAYALNWVGVDLAGPRPLLKANCVEFLRLQPSGHKQ